LTLFVIATVVAWWDWQRNRARATKWKEYLFLLLVMLLGAVMGVANDLVTSHLSPEYFIYGKGIIPGPGFRKGVLELATQAGLVAAFVGGAAYLFANNRRPGLPSLTYSRLGAYILWPLLSPVFFAVTLGLVSRWLVNARTDAEMTKFFGESKAIWFWRVWYIHLGLYAGLTLGVILGVINIRRARRRLAGLS
jgi:hypothetical protein